MRGPHPVRAGGRRIRAFTLIELMVVIGIMAIVVTTAVPIVYKIAHKEPMRKALSEVQEVFMNARAQAILKGQPVDVIVHPNMRRFDVSSAAPPVQAATPDVPSLDPRAQTDPQLPVGSGRTAVIAPEIDIEMLDINLREYKNAELARVRFFPNGTCDEMTLILHHGAEWKKVWLEVTTGLVDMSDVR